ncbi:MAG: hypothetical protein M3P18_04470 [Actinomycetota bacterium]|nr:hypothetical protein [Actinomycetota bacterium]
MSLNDWVRALQVLSAFALVAGIVLFWILVVVVRRIDLPEATIRVEPVVKVGNVAVGIGGVGTIIFGVWLAISLDAYEVWDGWVIAAIVLWAIAMATGQRAGVAYRAGMKRAEELQGAGQAGPSVELLAMNRTAYGLLMHALTSIAVALVLLDMIWKPGA